MDLSNPLVIGGILAIIGSIGGNIVLVIKAWKLDWKTDAIKADTESTKLDAAAAKQKSEDNATKLDTIHAATNETLTNTNGHLHKLQEQLARYEEREAASAEHENQLKQVISELTTVLAARGMTPPIGLGSRATDIPSDKDRREKS